MRVAFGVPTNHFLYADKLSLKLGADASDEAFNLPEPVLVGDKFSGKQKRVFGRPFEATRSLPAVRTGNLALTVCFQGCDDANCFFPEEKTFTISPDGSVAVVDAEIAGTPGDCIEQIRELRRLTGMDHLVTEFSFGSMPHHLAERDMRLFADRVMPVLQHDAAFQGEILPAPLVAGGEAERLFAPA